MKSKFSIFTVINESCANLCESLNYYPPIIYEDKFQTFMTNINIRLDTQSIPFVIPNYTCVYESFGTELNLKLEKNEKD